MCPNWATSVFNCKTDGYLPLSPRIFPFTIFPCQFNDTISPRTAFSFSRTILVSPIPVIFSSGKKNSAFEGNWVSRNNFLRAILISNRVTAINWVRGIFYSVPVDVYCLRMDLKSKNTIGHFIPLAKGGSKSQECHWLCDMQNNFNSNCYSLNSGLRFLIWDTKRLIHSTTMGHLTHEQKAKIVRLPSKNKNISEIVRILADDVCQRSRLSVRRFLRRFQEHQLPAGQLSKLLWKCWTS